MSRDDGRVNVSPSAWTRGNVCLARERTLSPGCCSLNAVDGVDPRRWQDDDAVCFVVPPFGGAHDVNPESRDPLPLDTAVTRSPLLSTRKPTDLRLPVNPHAPLRGRCRRASACIRDVVRYTASRPAGERMGKEWGREEKEGGKERTSKSARTMGASVCAEKGP